LKKDELHLRNIRERQTWVSTGYPFRRSCKILRRRWKKKAYGREGTNLYPTAQENEA